MLTIQTANEPHLTRSLQSTKMFTCSTVKTTLLLTKLVKLDFLKTKNLKHYFWLIPIQFYPRGYNPFC